MNYKIKISTVLTAISLSLISMQSCKKHVVSNRTLEVSTFAGDSIYGYKEGTGTAARFGNPNGIAFDASGNMYVADMYNNRIRKITKDGTVSTLAGNGTFGFKDTIASQAMFKYPSAVAVDAAGNVYVADEYNFRIRKISTNGMVTTLAGNGQYGLKDTSIGSYAMFKYTYDLAVDAVGNVFVADGNNNRIRKITPQGAVSTYAGGSYGHADGDALSQAKFQYPYGVVIDPSGNLYVSDYGYYIRKISPQGVVSTLAGTSEGFADGDGSQAQFRYAFGLGVDPQGNIYIADENNFIIRKMTPSGTVSTIAGSLAFGLVNGPARQARFNYPTDVAVDPTSGKLYVADASNNCIRKIE